MTKTETKSTVLVKHCLKQLKLPTTVREPFAKGKVVDAQHAHRRTFVAAMAAKHSQQPLAADWHAETAGESGRRVAAARDGQRADRLIKALGST